VRSKRTITESPALHVTLDSKQSSQTFCTTCSADKLCPLSIRTIRFKANGRDTEIVIFIRTLLLIYTEQSVDTIALPRLGTHSQILSR